MKKLLVFLLISADVCFFNFSFSQTPGEWVWLHGSNGTNNAGTYGVQGVSSPSNAPPATYTSCGWTDLNGNFWLFGGWRNYDVYGDLWKYDPAINEWTWMKGSGLPNDTGNFGVQGIAASSNNPPARNGAVSWTDSQGNLWMYSGNRGSDYCDLWKYEISTNEWTWMKGPRLQAQTGVYGIRGVSDPANYPGSRQETAASWTDAQDNLWLFGGYEFSGGNILFNDLWKYSIATNEWTWMKGSQSGNQTGIYGTLGVEDSSNTPGGRCPYSHWIDNAGNLWLWGGWNNSSGNFNDLWRYNPVTNNWTWIGGSNAINAPAVMGTKCIASASNIPETAWENRAVWKDNEGNFWFFGAGTYAGSFRTYNQLWKYCIASGEWAWVSGDAAFNPTGNWGTLGVSSPANKPSGRIGSVGWTDNNGHLYLFGGENNSGNTYNDLWMFTIDTACAVCAPVSPVAIYTAASNPLCPGTCTDFTNQSTNATSYQWFFPGAIPLSSTDVNPTSICYSAPGSYDVTLIAANANGSDTLTLSNYITVFPQPAPQSIIQSGDTLLANQGAMSYQWYFNGNSINGATDYFYVAAQSGDYNVVATDSNGCEVEAAIFDVVTGLTPVLSKGEGVMVFPNPVEEELRIIIPIAIKMEFGDKEVTIAIFDVIGSAVLLRTPNITLPTELDVRALPSGMYYLEVTSADKLFRTKFVKQ